MSFIPRRRVPTEALRLTLEQVLSHHFQSPRSIRRLRRRLSAYSSSCPIENLEVELDRGQRLRLVFKDLSPSSLLPTAREVRPAFLYQPDREIHTYRQVLDPAGLGTAVCYGAVASAPRGRYWLFLERVPGRLLWQVGRFESWEQAACWLAILHTAFDSATKPRLGQHQGWLLRYDEDFYRVWLERAEQQLCRERSPGSATARRRFRVLASHYDRVIRRLLDLPTTFTHGEFYPSNVILRATRHARQICPIDWELAALAPGLVDLGALIAGDWSRDHQKRLVAAYRERWEPARGGRPSLAGLLEAVHWCQLHRAIQFLGWAPHWSPPKPHAQDWLGEVLRLADYLGL